VRVTIFFAFPQEIKSIVRNLRAVKSKGRPFSSFIAEYSSKEIILIQTGMGARNAETALEYAMKEQNPDLVLSVGFAGALYSGAAAGDLILASRITLLPEFVSGTGRQDSCQIEVPNAEEMQKRLSAKLKILQGCVLTISRFMKKAEVRKIMTERLLNPVCDMETFSISRLCMEKGLPFFAIRSITDLADEEIPYEFFHVTDESGNYSFSHALSMLIRKPGLIPRSLRLGRNSNIASKNLWLAVKSLIEVL
jgi:nucleoside phosphorylase